MPLDPGDYGGTYKLVGGRLSFDFVNTVSYRSSDAPHDWLEPPANVITWALAVGSIDAAAARQLRRRMRVHARDVPRELTRLRRQRATVYDVLAPLAGGDSPPRPAMDAFNELLTGAVGHRRVHRTTLAWVWAPPERLDQIAWAVMLDAAHVLTESDHSRIGQCPSCDWLFYDGTRNRSRRWCDMVDCGSRDKSLRYYHRRRGR